MKAIVCLPTKNEIESIENMIREIRTLDLPLFVCDEQSTDGTIEAAEKMGVKVVQRQGKGKGMGVQTAVRVAEEMGYDVLVLIDCDTTYPSEKIPELLTGFPEYDMVNGARVMQDINFLHRLANYIHTGFVNLLFGSRFKDINTGLRAFKIKPFKAFLNATNMDIEAQISCIAAREKLKFKEIPICYGERLGRSKIRAWDGVLIILTIVKERFK